MQVRVDSLLEGAARATGAVVIIDVFRAFTTAAVALSRGANEIIVVGGVEEAMHLRDAGIGQICMGEVGGIKPDGFDLGNSPFEASQADLAGKTIIQRTSAGTQGIVTAKQATRLYAGSLVTARALTRVLRAHGPEQVTLVGMGLDGKVRTDEDDLCAIHLRNLLQGRPGSITGTREVILAGPQIPDFADPAKPHLHPRDLDIALDIDRFDFAVCVTKENSRLVARKETAWPART
jgi:2-phosphosulfolactate phosphatase